VVARFDDPDAIAGLAQQCDVVTFEVEHVSLESARAAAGHRPVRPSPEALAICQHRAVERRFLEAHGFPVAPWREVARRADLSDAFAALGTPCRVKIPFAGYDGRGQVRVGAAGELAAVDALGWERAPLLVEREIPFSTELSVVTARGQDGGCRTYPVIRTVHDEGILIEASVPAPVSQAVADRAMRMAESVAGALGLVGVLAVELFLLEHGELLINELAPRPHNSAHVTIDACQVSQFAQHVRAICGLPLGAAVLHSPAAMVNLLGDRAGPVRLGGVHAALADPNVTLHLYGKGESWPRRKLGHVTALGETTGDALARARQAAQRLSWVAAPNR
jgi:5-(carboxyamino)imidazole ribonucleotide synthase